MIASHFKDFNIILASGSPRRQQFFKELNINFSIQIKSVDEIYPEELKGEEIALYLSKLKAAAFDNLSESDILITGDTIVLHKNKCLGKPANSKEAFDMIKSLSGSVHEVVSAVCFTSAEKQVTVRDTAKVWFKELRDEEINYYVKNYKPFDKAGAYGIQEWIGAIGVTKIEGSYNTVMGLPTHLVYKTLMEFVKR
ncbi:MAG: Maf family nucleotide pyrophosphatase [Flavobacteriaceae bacterium]